MFLPYILVLSIVAVADDNHCPIPDTELIEQYFRNTTLAQDCIEQDLEALRDGISNLTQQAEYQTQKVENLALQVENQTQKVGNLGLQVESLAQVAKQLNTTSSNLSSNVEIAINELEELVNATESSATINAQAIASLNETMANNIAMTTSNTKEIQNNKLQVDASIEQIQDQLGDLSTKLQTTSSAVDGFEKLSANILKQLASIDGVINETRLEINNIIAQIQSSAANTKAQLDSIRDSINANNESINTNTNSIDTNTKRINTNTERISTNTERIESMEMRIEINERNISNITQALNDGSTSVTGSTAVVTLICVIVLLNGY